MVFIDNIENILSVEDSEDMKPLMDGIRKLAKELGIPIICVMYILNSNMQI